MNNNGPLTVYIIAGESSGDLLGAHLMRAIKEKSARPVQFFGVGGERMAAEGLASIFPYQELSMLGFVEILPYIFNLAARISQTVDDVIAKRPDIVVTIDVPGFCLRVVEKLRAEKLQAKFVHYVAPTVWAYNAWRAETCAKLFDHLLALLPFEPPYFEKVGLPCTFIGHPVVAETPVGNGAAFRQKYEIPDDAMLLALFPGSRKSEVERHMPIFARTATMLASTYSKLALAVAVPKNVLPFVAPYFEGCPFRAVIMANDQDKKDAIAGSNLAIVKSGTITLEVAMAGTPMVISYRVNPLSAWAMKRKTLTKYISLINILHQREVIPELLQDACTPLMLATAASQLLRYPELQAAQKAAMQQALAQLHAPDSRRPSDIAADVILGLAGS